MITDEMVIKALHKYVSGDHDTPEQAVRAALTAANAAAWRPIEEAPRDQFLLGVVDGRVRVIHWGKTSHIPLYG